MSVATPLNGLGFQGEISERCFRSGRTNPLRDLILALSVVALVAGLPGAEASPSMTDRYTLTSVDPADIASAATQETEDRIGLDSGQRRDVQRRLTALGFRTRATGRFDKSTRAAITRWQAVHGFPKTGFLNPLQHEALLGDSASVAPAGDSSKGETRRRHAGSAHHHRGPGGPIGLIGGVVGGLFGRR